MSWNPLWSSRSRSAADSAHGSRPYAGPVRGSRMARRWIGAAALAAAAIACTTATPTPAPTHQPPPPAARPGGAGARAGRSRSCGGVLVAGTLRGATAASPDAIRAAVNADPRTLGLLPAGAGTPDRRGLPLGGGH